MLKRWILLLLCTLLLVACDKDKDYEPEKFQQAALEQQASSVYTVKQGDTLFAIALGYNISHLKLAQWNSLSPPYRLAIGQTIQLFNGISQKKPSPLTHKKSQKKSRLIDTYKVKKGDTLYSIGRRFNVDHDILAGLNNLPSAEQVYIGQVLKIFKPKQKHSSANLAKNKPSITKNTPFKPQKSSIISNNKENMLKFYTQLPVEGKILKNFSQTGHRGIEISGIIGQTVTAAAAGKVVAVSAGLYGHGITIVIQHHNRYISSYANNRRAFVRTGQTVVQGQAIAEVGQIGRNPPSVKFEISKNGKLVNPMFFLATR